MAPINAGGPSPPYPGRLVRIPALILVLAVLMILAVIRIKYHLDTQPPVDVPMAFRPAPPVRYRPLQAPPARIDLWFELTDDIPRLDAAPGCRFSPAQAGELLNILHPLVKDLETLQEIEDSINPILTQAQRAYIFKLRDQYISRIALPRVQDSDSPLLVAALTLVHDRSLQPDSSYRPRVSNPEENPPPIILKDLLWGVVGLDLDPELRLSPAQARAIRPHFEQAAAIWPRLKAAQKSYGRLLTPVQNEHMARPRGEAAPTPVARDQALPATLKLLKERAAQN